MRGLALLATVLVAAAALVAADRPISASNDFATVGNINTEQVIQFRPNVRIPDNGELNWPLFVGDEFALSDVRIKLKHLYHPYMNDLRITLRHDDTVVDVTNLCGGDKNLGKPTEIVPPVVPGSATPAVTGQGFDYIFTDGLGDNLVLNKQTNQSTTRFNGWPWLAVDGNVDPFFSGGSVSHTAPQANDTSTWWQVDMGEMQVVGSIRVWSRADEREMSEVQAITTAGVTTLAGSFKLSFTNRGETRTTGSISALAVARASQEVDGSTNPGEGLGESVQSKLQALGNIGSVYVTRSQPGLLGQYTWTVTFIGDPGDVLEMTVAENGITSQLGGVTVETHVQGSSNIWQDENGDVVTVVGDVAPAVIMLLPNTTDFTVHPNELRLQASWFREITDPFDERLFALPVNTTGQIIRYQLTEPGMLALTEVQAYRGRTDTFCTYQGGTPVPAGTYHGTESLQSAFATKQAHGSWVLSIDDLAARERVYSDNSRPDKFIHGQGALGWWDLILVNSTGHSITYHADVQFKIDTLPVYGTLYLYDAVTATNSSTFGVVEGLQKYLSSCYGNCVPQFGVGTALSTSKDGSVTTVNRCTLWDHDGSVLYVPNEDYLGLDHFTYRTFIGVELSQRATVTVHTRKCRLDCDNEYFDDLRLWRGG